MHTARRLVLRSTTLPSVLSGPLLALLLALLLATAPRAEAVGFTVAVGSDLTPGGIGSLRLRAGLHDLRVGDDAFDLGVGWRAGAPSAAASWRRTLAAGVLGTLVVEGVAGIAAEGAAATLAARGTLGPVALRLTADVGRRVPGPWPELARAPVTAAPPPDLARLVAGADATRLELAAVATWRIDRSWTLDAHPRVHRSPAGWAGASALSLRRAAVATDLDLSVRIDAATGAAARHAAIGVSLHHAPRRAPESRAVVWWGTGTAGTGPGLEVAWVARAATTQLTVAAGWGPPWSDRPQAYAGVALTTPWEDGNLHLGGRWVTGGNVAVEIATSRPLRR